MRQAHMSELCCNVQVDFSPKIIPQIIYLMSI